MADNLITMADRGEPKRGRGRPRGPNGNAFREQLEEQVSEEARVSNRQAAIRDACSRIAALEGERASIGADIREIKQTTIKGELGFKLSDFATCYRLYTLEGDDRAVFFDTLRETFAALGVGEQLDFLDQ